MTFIRRFAYSLLAGFLISRGAASDPNWLFTILGLTLWLGQLHNKSTSYKIQTTFVAWYITGLFSLDWLRVLGWDAQLFLCLLVATSWSLFIWLIDQLFPTRQKILHHLVFAFGVVVLEFILSYAPFGGFNWLRLAYLLTDSPIVSLTYWLGIPALSFIGILFALTLSEIRKYRTPPIFLGVFVLVLLVILPGPSSTQNETGLNVLVVQGSVPRVGLDFNAQRTAVFFNHLRTTQKAIDEYGDADIDLVLWPENSSDIDPYQDPIVAKALSDFQDKYSLPILFGAVLTGAENLSNAAVVSTGEGLDTVYVKRKLVPFGEYLPFRNLLAPLISRFDRLSRDFEPGNSNSPVDIDDASIGILICYEVAFDNLWQSYSKNADYLFVMTNNATYGGTKQPLQQLRITQLQAIGNGRPVAIASTSGISAFVSTKGEIKHINEENEPFYFLQEIPKTLSAPPSATFANFFNGLAIILLAGLIVNQLRIRLMRKN